MADPAESGSESFRNSMVMGIAGISEEIEATRGEGTLLQGVGIGIDAALKYFERNGIELPEGTDVQADIQAITEDLRLSLEGERRLRRLNPALGRGAVGFGDA